MLFTLITKLQRRPEHERQVVTFVAAAVLTLFVGAIWLASATDITPESTSVFVADVREGESSIGISPVESIKRGADGFLGEFGDAIGGAVGSVKDVVDGLRL
jgi:hypothetical protein